MQQRAAPDPRWAPSRPPGGGEEGPSRQWRGVSPTNGAARSLWATGQARGLRQRRQLPAVSAGSNGYFVRFSQPEAVTST